MKTFFIIIRIFYHLSMNFLAGDICTIKWMFGLPEAVDFLRQHHVEEGETIQVIRKLRDSLIIGVQNERVALGKEIADRIQV